MKIIGKNIDGLTFGIFGFIVLLVSYYIGSRTGKGKSVVGEILQLSKDINKSELTYDLSEYETMSQRLFIAMYDIGTNEGTIYNVMSRMRNNSDILQLVSTFGKRGGFFQGGAKTLAEWLEDDLDSSEIKKVNEILTRNNITFQF